MAMAECSECGEKVSSDAKTCPHCGKDHPAGSTKMEKAGAAFGTIGCLMLLSPVIILIIIIILAT